MKIFIYRNANLGYSFRKAYYFVASDLATAATMASDFEYDNNLSCNDNPNLWLRLNYEKAISLKPGQLFLE